MMLKPCVKVSKRVDFITECAALFTVYEYGEKS